MVILLHVWQEEIMRGGGGVEGELKFFCLAREIRGEKGEVEGDRLPLTKINPKKPDIIIIFSLVLERILSIHG